VGWDELARDAEDQNQRDKDRLIGVYIAVLAVILALCTMGGGNAAKEATLKNIEASNLWAFFQSKNLRRQALRLQVDQLEIMRDGDPNLPFATRSAIEAKIADYKAQDALLTSDKARNEGLDELFVRAKALEVERDEAMQRDPYFDYGEAFLQIAIVLAGVAIISGGSSVLAASAVVAAMGALMTLNGFTLLLPLPFIG
jgi:hypothetical protein